MIAALVSFLKSRATIFHIWRHLLMLVKPPGPYKIVFVAKIGSSSEMEVFSVGFIALSRQKSFFFGFYYTNRTRKRGRKCLTEINEILACLKRFPLVKQSKSSSRLLLQPPRVLLNLYEASFSSLLNRKSFFLVFFLAVGGWRSWKTFFTAHESFFWCKMPK